MCTIFYIPLLFSRPTLQIVYLHFRTFIAIKYQKRSISPLLNGYYSLFTSYFEWDDGRKFSESKKKKWKWNNKKFAKSNDIYTRHCKYIQFAVIEHELIKGITIRRHRYISNAKNTHSVIRQWRPKSEADWIAGCNDARAIVRAN